MKGYLQIRLRLPAKEVEPVAGALEQLGALSVSLQGEGALFEPVPGETPLWPEVVLEALFPASQELGPILASLSRRFGELEWESSFLPERRWELVWRDHFRPLRFGRLYIAPANQPPAEAGLIHLKLEPGLAFGTGTHPTTALCLEALSELELAGKRIIDYGCGSGILAIAALLLGAREAEAVDIDPQALEAAAENARRNRVVLNLYRAPEELPRDGADLLVANILAGPLLELAPRFARLVKPSGHLLLSGLLREQTEPLLERYGAWFSFEPPRQKEEWVLLLGRRRWGGSLSAWRR